MVEHGAKSNRGRRLVAIIAVGLSAAYFVGFHGEYREDCSKDGTRFTKTQYFMHWRLYESKGSDPPGLWPPSPGACFWHGETRVWRGFGLIWQRKVTTYHDTFGTPARERHYVDAMKGHAQPRRPGTDSLSPSPVPRGAPRCEHRHPIGQR